MLDYTSKFEFRNGRAYKLIVTSMLHLRADSAMGLILGMIPMNGITARTMSNMNISDVVRKPDIPGRKSSIHSSYVAPRKIALEHVAEENEVECSEERQRIPTICVHKMSCRRKLFIFSEERSVYKFGYTSVLVGHGLANQDRDILV